MTSLRTTFENLLEPVSAKCEIARKCQRISSHLPHNVGVQGSYWTTNIGDRAIGESIYQKLGGEQKDIRLFSNHIQRSNAAIHVLGGGGVMHDFYGVDHLRRRLDYVEDGGAIIGVGVPGVQSDTGKRLLSEGLSDVRLITVRDERSRNRLKPYYDGEIHLTACPALTLKNPSVPTTDKTGVSFRPWFDLDKETLKNYFGYNEKIQIEDAKEKYIENIRDICNSVRNPVFIPFHIDDERFAKRHLDIEVYPYVYSVEETLKRVSSVNRMVAMRYHALVFSIICRKPVLAIDYSPKVSSLASRVGVSSYRPHEYIPIEFEEISNRDKIRESSEKNFQYLNQLYQI
ncbi:polysaccharide pyruvyl transferase family protein [Haloferax sp. YSMS24]|uniref:polysaccharide pyruvyl transferase family protein n=1 Tax=Haloferax sp. YSMS24 TaxID=3388425 RepID=UPI00398CDC12